MAEYTAHLFTYASATIRMEVPDDVAAQGPEEISDWIMANSPDGPSICAQCSGWSRKASLDLGDFEPVQRDDAPHKGVAMVTDASGNYVNGN